MLRLAHYHFLCFYWKILDDNSWCSYEKGSVDYYFDWVEYWGYFQPSSLLCIVSALSCPYIMMHLLVILAWCCYPCWLYWFTGSCYGLYTKSMYWLLGHLLLLNEGLHLTLNVLYDDSRPLYECVLCFWLYETCL